MTFQPETLSNDVVSGKNVTGPGMVSPRLRDVAPGWNDFVEHVKIYYDFFREGEHHEQA